jgi:uncharacterized protein YbjT (DUF2867 family)
MTTVLVTGGTGHLGMDVVRRLKAERRHVRILARNPGEDPDVEWIKGDLGTGHGVADAVAGANMVVHAATNSPAAQRGMLRMRDFVGSPSDVDVDGTRMLLAEAAKDNVEHFLHISIIGVQQSRLPYMRVKAAAEDVVRAGPVPWSILPAAAFYWLFARMFDTMASRRVWPLPANIPTQPCDSAEFASHVVACLNDGPSGVRPDFGGPQVASMVEFAREYQAIRGIRRRILPLHLPARMVRAAGRQTCQEDGIRGTTTWSQWLASNQPGRAR